MATRTGLSQSSISRIWRAFGLQPHRAETFAELTTKRLRRGAHRSVHELRRDIREWVRLWNESPRPFAGIKSADETLDSVARHCL
jgi:hypothetical protein